jgi:predicted dehydrogenase/nucleoside-diphosphate-sugar epimerase
MSEPQVRLAIIGCGAVAEYGHLPAAAGVDGLVVSALVDPDLERARLLAGQHGVEQTASDISALDPPPDAALLAVPHHLHAAMSIALLRRGIHVLVEKPMALTLNDCDEMIRIAAERKVWLAVGLARRFMPVVCLGRATIAAGALGSVTGFSAHDGRAFDWPVQSDFLFRRALSGGGVLTDLGSHTLDTLLFLLGDLEVLEYRDDSCGGVEAEAEIDVALASGAAGRVELSRTRDLGCAFEIRGSDATLQIDLWTNAIRLVAGADSVDLAPGLPDGAADADFFRDQLTDWVQAIRDRRPPAVSGTEGRRSVALMAECYRRKRTLALPWQSPAAPQSAHPPLRGKRVLVTGATGFLGGHLVERLCVHEGAAVRVLVRDLARASRISRFAIEIVHGDVTDAQAVRRAASDCEFVFHLAAGNRGSPAQERAVNIDGTELVAQAALRAGAARLVQVSTIVISARTPPGDLDEVCLPVDPDPYSESKLDAERRVLALCREDGLPVVVVRPSCIYGPYDHGYTVGPIQELRAGPVVLVDGGVGLCNLVYVDDVVSALLLAATAPRAVGEAFLISGAAPVTWRDFFGAYQRMVPGSSTVSMSACTIRAQLRQSVGVRQDLGLPRLPPAHMVDFYAARPHIRIDKARRILGYQPRFDLTRGMALTERWARSAGLLPEPMR